MGREREERDDEGARSFARFVEMVADGALHSEASEALHKLVCALEDDALDTHSTSKGELTIKVKLAVEPNGVVSVTYDLKAKEPVPTRPKGVLWLTKGGNLTPQNPRQQRLPLHEVSIEAGPAREVGGATKAREV